MLTTRRQAMAAAAILTGSLLLSSCGGSDSNSSDGKTLKLWHYEGPDSAMGVAWNEAIKEFEAQHPGVKVKFEEKGFEQIQKTAPMVLNSSTRRTSWSTTRATRRQACSPNKACSPT
jgi:raffinose/stachyose/melibiose transport system substrate-binding protein